MTYSGQEAINKLEVKLPGGHENRRTALVDEFRDMYAPDVVRGIYDALNNEWDARAKIKDHLPNIVHQQARALLKPGLSQEQLEKGVEVIVARESLMLQVPLGSEDSIEQRTSD